jgi:hypothetical protein
MSGTLHTHSSHCVQPRRHQYRCPLQLNSLLPVLLEVDTQRGDRTASTSDFVEGALASAWQQPAKVGSFSKEGGRRL